MSNTLNKKQKLALAVLWDALSEILEDPETEISEELRKHGTKAIAQAFECADDEILNICRFTVNDDGSCYCKTHSRLSPGPALYCPEGAHE